MKAVLQGAEAEAAAEAAVQKGIGGNDLPFLFPLFLTISGSLLTLFFFSFLSKSLDRSVSRSVSRSRSASPAKLSRYLWLLQLFSSFSFLKSLRYLCL